ncbi:methyltransferase domain-containing protein [Aquibium sp. ELW1220]|uniref:class I SAM-dependent methyltransferase n=1 Tax=Aquibium sp. ELW1220 TaxID=2976766 RepID=UPI0025AFBAFF|nr:methyltransferase domain-containing protein [Aquibium sp. ELW1220]MDN2583379.1 class I SAM-dependent methyltransferase [Aquibium sp. ELW1220]
MQLEQLMYFIQGFAGGFGTKPVCPSCASQQAEGIDRKYFHQLLRCTNCGLLFRFPRETERDMVRFYQTGYQQSGLTTDLPDDETLATLMTSNFVGTAKDFTRFIDLFGVLSIAPGARVLDFGANWGYGMHQFQNAGFSVTGFEVSVPRAAFGEKLGLKIHTIWSNVVSASPFDVAFSAHVLEHTPDPAEAIKRQISVLKPGGYLIAVFPHGSPIYRDSDFEGFHKLWGRVHPVLPTVEFLTNTLPSSNCFIGALTDADLKRIASWNGTSKFIGDTTRSELLVVFRA